jgi:hypothetical protein
MQRFNDAVRKEQLKNMLLSEVKIRLIYEGDSYEVITEDGYSDKGANKLVPLAKFNVSDEEVIAKGPEALFARVQEIGKEAGEKSAHEIVLKMQEVTDRTKNTIDAKSEKLSLKHILALMDKMQVDFDDFGKMNNLVFVSGPELSERMRIERAKWEKDPVSMAIYGAIIVTKRLEWFDRQNNRKLVE